MQYYAHAVFWGLVRMHHRQRSRHHLLAESALHFGHDVIVGGKCGPTGLVLGACRSSAQVHITLVCGSAAIVLIVAV